MNFRISHMTSYSYSEPVGICWNEACLLPRDTPGQSCISSRLSVQPNPVDLRERRDFFGNRRTHFSIQQNHGELTVTASCEVAVAAQSKPETSAAWERIQQQLTAGSDRTVEILQALIYLPDSPQIRVSQELRQYAEPSFPAGRPLVEAAEDLMRRIYADFTYDPGFTTIATPLEKVLSSRRGVCQDFAHLGVGCLRAMGIPARYVSGYIETLPPPGKKRLVGADASHAWFSVFAGEAGWVDFDPTNNQIPSNQHITVAWGRDFLDVSPLKGVALGGGKHSVRVSVDVARYEPTAGSNQSQSAYLS